MEPERPVLALRRKDSSGCETSMLQDLEKVVVTLVLVLDAAETGGIAKWDSMDR